MIQTARVIGREWRFIPPPAGWLNPGLVLVLPEPPRRIALSIGGARVWATAAGRVQ